MALIVPLLAWADALVVAGHAQQFAAPFILEGNEVLAPAVPALWLLGTPATVTGNAISLALPHGHPLTCALNSTAAQIGERTFPLEVAPRGVDGTIYLPMRALATLINAEARYDTATRTLNLDPLLSISYETRAEGVALLVRCAAPLEYSSGRIDGDQPRTFFDFKHVSLGLAEQQIPVNESPVQRLRLSQYTINPDIVRLVVDLTQDAAITTTVDEQGCLVTIVLGEKAPAAAPVLPASPATPAVPAPCRLTNLTLKPVSEKQTEVLLTADGAIQSESSYDADHKQLTLHFPHAVNALPAECVGACTDKVVAALQVDAPAADGPVSLVLTFRRDAGYLIEHVPAGLSILLGTFNISDMVVVLDAGHGGYQVGAVGYSGTLEKDITLDVVQRTAKLLRAAGAKVLLTRSDDSYVSLEARAELANTHKADLFIAVHCNSSPHFNCGDGSQTYYTTARSANLASAMHKAMVDGLGLRDAGIHQESLYVTHHSTMPAVLLELAYINNRREEQLLNTPEFRQKSAEAILNGVRRYATCAEWRLHHADASTGETAIAQTPGGR